MKKVDILYKFVLKSKIVLNKARTFESRIDRKIKALSKQTLAFKRQHNWCCLINIRTGIHDNVDFI